MFLKRHFRDQVVLITGASSGIGEALALELARRGARLALAARRKDKLETLAARIKKEAGSEALALECDVTRDGDLETAVAATVRKFGRLDVAIANAGFGVTGTIAELSVEDYRRQFETNVFGVLRTVKAVLEELKKSRGSLALLGSVAGHIALPQGSPYAMSKFAVHALAESLRHELKPDGISVTLISPGFVDSDIRRVDNEGRLHAGSQDPISPWLRMPAEVAARHIARAIACRRAEAVITFHGKVAVFIQRHFPWLMGLMKGGGLRSRGQPR